MKKRFVEKMAAIAMMAALSVSMLSGCGSDSSASTGDTGSTTAETESAVAPATEAASEEVPALGADTQAIVDRGVLKVGVKNAVIGFGFQDTLTGE